MVTEKSDNHAIDDLENECIRNLGQSLLAAYFSTSNEVNQRSMDILSKRYGLGGEVYKLSEIAEIYGISSARVSQIASASFYKFKKIANTCETLASIREMIEF